MPQLWNHRSASFLKSSLSSMTRTRVMSRGKGRRNADFMQSAGDNPPKAFASISASTGAGTRGLLVSVERERIPGDAVPDQSVPGEQRPENAAEQRIDPLQRRTKKHRVQRAGEAVGGPESAIGTGYGSRVKERADEEPTRQEPGAGRRIARHSQGGGVRIEQPAAVRDRIGENLTALLPVRLRRSDEERRDLIGGRVRPSRQDERGGPGYDGGRHR